MIIHPLLIIWRAVIGSIPIGYIYLSLYIYVQSLNNWVVLHPLYNPQTNPGFNLMVTQFFLHRISIETDPATSTFEGSKFSGVESFVRRRLTWLLLRRKLGSRVFPEIFMAKNRCKLENLPFVSWTSTVFFMNIYRFFMNIYRFFPWKVSCFFERWCHVSNLKE